jgi:hypothetical protein
LREEKGERRKERREEKGERRKETEREEGRRKAARLGCSASPSGSIASIQSISSM